MTAVRANAVLDCVRRTAYLGNGELGDAQLLDDFIACREEAAFAELLRRHGPMVLGVCRRVLANPHDAEDAFQATFLILVRKAATIQPRHLVCRWLYGVAYRTALKARQAARRRREREQIVGQMRSCQSEVGESVELRALLDREITRLPEKYRSAVILCELDGLSRKEAARLLGLPEGTLSSRLAAARNRLARRFSRHGRLLSAGAVSLLLAREAHAVPVSLLKSTEQMAAASGLVPPHVLTLVEGVLTTMWLSKFKMVPVLLLAIAALSVGVSGRPYPAQAANPEGQKEKKELGPIVHGTVSATDANKGTLTLTVLVAPDKKQTEQKALMLSPDVKIVLADSLTKTETPAIGKVADLIAGTIVAARLSVDGKQVVEVHASGPGVQGMVKSVDAASNAITISFKGKDGPTDQTLHIVKGAKVLLSDGLTKGTAPKEGSLSDISEGTPVSIRQSVDRKLALQIDVHGKSVHGTLKSLDTGSNTLTVTVKEDAQIVEKTFTIAKDARVDSGAVAGKTVTVQISVFDKTVATGVHVHEK